MTDETTTTAEAPVEDTVEDAVAEVEEPTEIEAETSESAQITLDSTMLENAKLRAILKAYSPKMNLDQELKHVGGLAVTKGKVSGDVAYRLPAKKSAGSPKIEKETKTETDASLLPAGRSF